ncbi:MAG: hypothetical protein AAF768_13060 [Pseudomonadota bacterium]
MTTNDTGNLAAIDASIFQNSLLLFSKVKILIVLDNNVGEGLSIVEGNGFGIGRVIRWLRESQIAGLSFDVDLANREPQPGSDGEYVDLGEVGPGQYRYYGWRFDIQPTDSIEPTDADLVLNRYDIVMFFGWQPGSIGGDDAEILAPGSNPLSDRELRFLTGWMNRGGGVFATGDHGRIGASMCSRIPRVGTMRKWTNADGVPPASFDTYSQDTWRYRLNTIQPGPTQQQVFIPASAQTDAIAKPIFGVTLRCEPIAPFTLLCYPHPVLEHPDYVFIDVMPDHDHEGLCQDPSAIDLNATLDFMPSNSNDEYPTISGIQPRPEALASARTTHEFLHEYGPVNARSYAIVSAYNGHQINIGRVVVDSTWHQWLDLNIRGFIAEDGANWDKVGRYFLNVVRYLARRGSEDAGKVSQFLLASFSYPGAENLSPPSDDILQNGSIIRQHLHNRLGPSSTLEFVLNLIEEAHPRFAAYLNTSIVPLTAECSNGTRHNYGAPRWESIEMTVLGAIYNSTYKHVEELRADLKCKPDGSEINIDLKQVQADALAGVEYAIKSLDKTMEQEVSNFVNAIRTD